MPQCGYRALEFDEDRTNLASLVVDEIKDMLNLIVKAHIQKRSFLRRMEKPGFPLHGVSKSMNKGKAYLDLNHGSYLIGVIGLNNLVEFITGKQMNESKESLKLGLYLIAEMKEYAEKLTEKHKIKLTLVETPAESAAHRIAMTDMRLHKERASKVVRGSKDNYYYDNSVHFEEGKSNFLERLMKQSTFHALIESSIVHVWAGEKNIDPKAVFSLVKKVQEKTVCSEFCISPTFTFCSDCEWHCKGIEEVCKGCGSKDVSAVSRPVGYYSLVKNWNRAKKEEFARRKTEAIV